MTGKSRKETLVLQRTAEYAARLGIPAPEVLFKDTPELRLGKALARCYIDHGIFRISLKGRSLRELYSTIAHELIHFRFPRLSHGIGFEQHVSFLQRGQLFFNGRGLVTKFPKPKKTKIDKLSELKNRQKKLTTKIKRLLTLQLQIHRKIKRLEATKLE